MAQPIYSTSVRIDSFRGLNQTGTGANMDLRFAAEMENVNVHNGEFAPMREGLRLAQELDEPIGTLAYLSRRYVENPDTLLVAISDGKVYTKELDGVIYGYTIIELPRDPHQEEKILIWLQNSGIRWKEVE